MYTALKHVREHGAEESSLKRLHAPPLKALRLALGDKPGTAVENVNAIVVMLSGRNVDEVVTPQGLEAAGKIKATKPKPKPLQGPFAKGVLPLPDFDEEFVESVRVDIAGSSAGGRALVVDPTGLGKTELLAAIAKASAACGGRLTQLGPFSHRLYGIGACAAVQQLGALSIADVQLLLPAHVRLVCLDGTYLVPDDEALKERLASVQSMLTKVPATLRNLGDQCGANKLITAKPLLQCASYPRTQQLCALLDAANATHDLGYFGPLSADRQRRREYELYELEGLKSQLSRDGTKREVKWTLENETRIREKCAPRRPPLPASTGVAARTFPASRQLLTCMVCSRGCHSPTKYTELNEDLNLWEELFQHEAMLPMRGVGLSRALADGSMYPRVARTRDLQA
jgi:hypothetical protein